SFIIITFPTASVVAKYFFATSSFNTIECGSVKQVLGSPDNNGNVSTEKKFESTYNTPFCSCTSAPFFISSEPASTRTKDFIPGTFCANLGPSKKPVLPLLWLCFDDAIR